MGDFRIVINAVGGHGVDRDKKDGEIVDFNQAGLNTTDAIASRLVKELLNSGVSIQDAKIIHWPLDNYGGPEKNGRTAQIEDDLITGKRTGNF